MKNTRITTAYQSFNHKIKASCKEDLKEEVNRIIDEIPPFLESNTITFSGIVTISKKANEVGD